MFLDHNASASEDFAYYGKLMPSFFAFLGATPENQDLIQAAPNHSPYFIVDNKALKTGTELHVRFVLDYPNISKQVQTSWKPSSLKSLLAIRCSIFRLEIQQSQLKGCAIGLSMQSAKLPRI